MSRIARMMQARKAARAWQMLREDSPNVHLLIVGEFESQDPVPEEMRHSLETDPYVHLAGLDWNTPALYAAMDVLALPSHREGLPNVVLEAAAMALPVVATRIPGCVDAVQDSVTGILVPPRNVVALAEALQRYVTNPALRKMHGRAGRARVLRDFRPQPLWEALYREYARLLRQNGVPYSAPADPELYRRAA